MTGGPNGMWNGEYWLVTTTDGTKYYFGADHVPGSPSSSLTTNSAWNVPVYCPASTDPCNSSTWTQMPYRWNLDYVVDPDNNLTVYQYATETNYLPARRGGRWRDADQLHPGRLPDQHPVRLAPGGRHGQPGGERGGQGRVRAVGPVHGQQLHHA